jgi:hypothetical protein
MQSLDTKFDSHARFAKEALDLLRERSCTRSGRLSTNVSGCNLHHCRIWFACLIAIAVAAVSLDAFANDLRQLGDRNRMDAVAVKSWLAHLSRAHMAARFQSYQGVRRGGDVGDMEVTFNSDNTVALMRDGYYSLQYTVLYQIGSDGSINFLFPNGVTFNPPSDERFRRWIMFSKGTDKYLLPSDIPLSSAMNGMEAVRIMLFKYSSHEKWFP